MNEPVSVWRVTLAMAVFTVVTVGVSVLVAFGNLSFGVGLFLGGAASLICGLVAFLSQRGADSPVRAGSARIHASEGERHDD